MKFPGCEHLLKPREIELFQKRLQTGPKKNYTEINLSTVTIFYSFKSEKYSTIFKALKIKFLWHQFQYFSIFLFLKFDKLSSVETFAENDRKLILTKNTSKLLNFHIFQEKCWTFLKTYWFNIFSKVCRVFQFFLEIIGFFLKMRVVILNHHLRAYLWEKICIFQGSDCMNAPFFLKRQYIEGLQKNYLFFPWRSPPRHSLP